MIGVYYAKDHPAVDSPASPVNPSTELAGEMVERGAKKYYARVGREHLRKIRIAEEAERTSSVY